MQNMSHRLVHLDLKGAPWKVNYLSQVIRLTKEWGATGILVEWEDSFPYTGHLAAIGSLGDANRDGLYSSDKVQEIMQIIEDNGLDLIQLVQSIGHLEFVLKHPEFSSMRELSYSPAVLCPTRPGSKCLVVEMMRQVLAVQPRAKYIHIGADEAYHMNRCDACTSKTSLNLITSVDSLFLDHIIGIVTAVRETFPNVKFLMWDDMLRGMHEQSIIDSELHKYVTPVVWKYAPVGSFKLEEQMWEKYQKAFSEVWIASAFKGANRRDQMAPCVALYKSNQEAWMEELKKLEGGTLKVTGLVITGWSRYNHYASLCELLPVAIPSLLNCLSLWNTHTIDMEDLESIRLSPEMWPGADCSMIIENLYMCRQQCLAFLHGDLVGAWMTPWQINNAYTNPLHILDIQKTATQFLCALNSFYLNMSNQLQDITGPRSTEEWLHTNISSLFYIIKKIALDAEARVQLPASVVPIPRLSIEEIRENRENREDGENREDR